MTDSSGCALDLQEYDVNGSDGSVTVSQLAWKLALMNERLARRGCGHGLQRLVTSKRKNRITEVLPSAQPYVPSLQVALHASYAKCLSLQLPEDYRSWRDRAPSRVAA